MAPPRLEVLHTLDALAALRSEWNDLAAAARSPFLTVEWLESWWRAFGAGPPVVAVLREADGDLLAAACLRRARGGLHAAANVHSGDWDAVARDEATRRAFWRELGAITPRLRLLGLVQGEPAAAAVQQELAAAGFRLVERPFIPGPRLDLPASWDELLASVSRNLRSQLGRRRRALEREGELRLRTVADGDELASALDHVLRLEAGGWKGRAGSAISSDPRTAALYRGFAGPAAGNGWLRLHLLELDGRPIAADYGLAHAGVGYLLKTGFDEAWSRHSPGMVLRAEVLRASIEEGLTAYEFLGGAETYKMQWGPRLRTRIELHAMRGAATIPAWTWWAVVRPRVRPLAQRALRARESRARAARDAPSDAHARPGRPPAARDRGGSAR